MTSIALLIGWVVLAIAVVVWFTLIVRIGRKGRR